MVQVTYPGVYIQEVPSGVNTITGVATSVAAFVGYFREGPMNTPVQIFGMTDFNRVFGGLDNSSEAGYAINQFFLNGGTEAHVVRVAGGTPARASVEIADGPVGGTVVMLITAINEGEWGDNLRAYIDHNTTDPTSLFNLTVSRHTSQDDLAPVVATETYLNLSSNPTHSRYFVPVVNDASALVEVSHPTVDLLNPDSNAIPASNGTFGIAITAAIGVAMDGGEFNVNIGGAGAQVATLNFGGATPTDLIGLRPFVEAAIRAALPTNPAYSSATVEIVGGNRLLIKAGRSDPAYSVTSRVAITAVAGDSLSEDLGFTGAGTGQTENIQEYTCIVANANTRAQINVGDGADGDVPDAAAINGDPSLKTGIYALEDVDLFNILCIPRTADLSDTEMTAAVSTALAYCQARRAFMIIDIPRDINTVQEIKDWLDTNNGFRSKNSALYFPRVLIPDPVNEFRARSVGASGTIAGLYARTDSTRGVWKAPAGTEATLRGLVRLDVKLTDPENGTLNPLAINCLRNFPIYGPVSWGARTLDGSDQAGSEWKYIPIRRLALFLEESLFRGTKWIVFEPNDEPLWSKIRLNLNAFMMNLFRQGAFQGTTPDKAFYVKCDAETTTQADRNLGIVNIEVGFAPLKPAEFVVIKIQQMAGDL